MSGATTAGTTAVPEPAPPGGLPRRSDRRWKLALLLLLTGLLAALVVLTGWYLLTRKPITQILPPLDGVSLPQFSYAVYGTSSPMGIAVTASGDRIYVTEMDGQRMVRIFDGKRRQIGSFAPPGSIPSNRLPMYVAVEPSTGDVYVSDRDARAIFVYSRDGVYRRTFQPGPTLPEWQPLGLAFDRDGDLWVGDVSDPVQRIHEFRPDGTLVRTVGDAGEFSFPNGLAVTTSGSLLVADGNHGRLAQFDAEGLPLAGVRRGMSDGELGLPRGVALDDQGRIYVTDTTASVVDVYRLDEAQRPVFVGLVGAYGLSDGQLRYPGGIAADARGRIYVADWSNDRVEVWSY